MVYLKYDDDGPNGFPKFLVKNIPGIEREVKQAAREVEIKAETNLRSARAATTHKRIQKSRVKTEVKLEKAPDRKADWLISLYASNPMALEYGHYPSGYFDPIKYKSITKSPSGLYILNRAAGFPAQNLVSAPTRKGQNAKSKKARKKRWKKTRKRNKKKKR